MVQRCTVFLVRFFIEEAYRRTCKGSEADREYPGKLSVGQAAVGLP